MSLPGLTIAAYQGPAIYGDTERSLENISETIRWAENAGADLICFPECFLQGYFPDEDQARSHSFDLSSEEFQKILERLQSHEPTLILGVIEQEEAKLYNTAVVIDRGKLIGKYRKQHLKGKESFFVAGNESPVFAKRGIKYGINICNDANYPASAKELADQGSQVIFYLLNNSLPHDVARRCRTLHFKNLIERAQDTGCWIVSSDVTEESATTTGYGYTAIVNPDGKVLEQVAELSHGRIMRYLPIFKA